MRSNFALRENFADQNDQDEYDITEVSGSKIWEDIITAENGSPVALQLQAPPQSKRKSPCAQVISL